MSAMEQIFRETGRIGKRGTMVIPAKLRKHYGLEEGAFIIVEARADGILIRPASVGARLTETHLEQQHSPIEELRRIGADAGLGAFDWEKWKQYRDEGRK